MFFTINWQNENTKFIIQWFLTKNIWGIYSKMLMKTVLHLSRQGWKWFLFYFYVVVHVWVPMCPCAQDAYKCQRTTLGVDLLIPPTFWERNLYQVHLACKDNPVFYCNDIARLTAIQSPQTPHMVSEQSKLLFWACEAGSLFP